MTKLSLITAPHQILRMSANPVQTVNEDILHLVRDLISVMKALNLLGINAPMMGKSWNLIIINVQMPDHQENDENFCSTLR